MALPYGAFDKERIYIPPSPLSPVRIEARGDGEYLFRAMSGITRTVLSDTETKTDGFTVKKYNLYVLRPSVKTPDCKGELIPAAEVDGQILTRLIRTMYADIGRGLSCDDAEAFSKNKRENTYVLRDGEICAMGRIAFEGSKYGRINTVVCLPEKRGGGFGKAVVSELCRMLKDRALIPTALAHGENPISNRMYLSLGFEKEGTLYEYTPVTEKYGETAITCGSLS